MPKFGPAGNSESFAALGYKNSLQVPEYIVEMGLDCYEYQCGRGVNIGEDKARQLGEKAKAAGVSLSLQIGSDSVDLTHITKTLSALHGVVEIKIISGQ